MTTNLRVNDRFPDIVLPNHQNESVQLSQLTKPGLLDQRLGFLDGCFHRYLTRRLSSHTFFFPSAQNELATLPLSTLPWQERS